MFEIMKASKRKKLEAARWKLGSAREFLGLSDEKAAFVELKEEEALTRGMAEKSREFVEQGAEVYSKA